MLQACLVLALGLGTMEPVKVELRQREGKWELLRGGKPFFVRGAGGDHSLEVLKAMGGNATRTWGAEELPRKLGEAEKLGLVVSGGIWLGHKRHGFDYKNADQVKEQYRKTINVIQMHRNHPALLVWALGNEMDWNNDVPEMWKAVGELAKMAKELDPNHPIMTVVAEIDESKIRNLKQYCPDIDILGVNSYGGLQSLAERLKKAGWTKPYMVTEFGPLGPWESGRTEWKAALEATSTEKAKFYAAGYEKSIAGQPGWCLGSFAFLWGHKQETTPTWFGMFLPTGEAVESADVMSRFWTSKWPTNRAPEINVLAFDVGRKRVEGGLRTSAAALATDPNGDKLTYRWEIRREILEERPTGEGEAGPELLAGYPKETVEPRVELSLPTQSGAYRLYLTVLDGKGKAATANEPFYIR